jgi:large subunit ribosomal protein L7/L12
MGNVAGLLEESAKLADAERVQLLGTLLEREGSMGLSRFLDKLEATLGLKRASGGGAAVVDQGPKKADAPTVFDVVLKSAGAKKIDVIKVIREVAGLDLMGAKNLADKGGDVKKALPKEEADAMAKKFKDAGADVELKPA